MSNLASFEDLTNLEGSLKQYTDTAVSSIPQPDLSDYLTKSNVLVVPMAPLIPGQDKNPLKNGNVLVPKRYVDGLIPNLSVYATKEEIPDLSDYATKTEMYYEGNPKKDLRIKYHADRSDNEVSHKNNIYITTANSIKFWVGNDSTTSTLTEVQFGNIIFGISGSNLTIKNATSFDVRPTLKSNLPAPTNDDDIVTKNM
jgi:hypothetical protein